jgi:two-component system chemotaxis response regulator CheB
MSSAPVKTKAIVIGASAGGLAALSEILSPLPAGYPLPIFVVVHVPPDHESMLVDVFTHKCRIAVKEAEDKESIRPGVVYFAPPNYHLLVENDFSLSLSSDDPELYSRPSINVLFESAKDAYGENLMGIVLTGANSDGARGLRAISDAGGMALVQDPRTAEFFDMPGAALKECPTALSLTLEKMARILAELPQNPPLNV